MSDVPAHKRPPELIRAYGDRKDDGRIQLSFTLPVAPSGRAKEAARRFAEALGLKNESSIDLSISKAWPRPMSSSGRPARRANASLMNCEATTVWALSTASAVVR